MTQAIDIVRDALGHLRVVDSTDVPADQDVVDALRALNNMVTAWESEGLAMGWQDITQPEQELPTPPEFDEALGYNLATRLRAKYGVTLDQDVLGFAQSGLGMIRAAVAASRHDRIAYDDLPRGESQPNIYGWRAGFYL